MGNKSSKGILVNVYLIRHGETDSNKQGIKQGKRVIAQH